MIDLRELADLSPADLVARARANPAWFRYVLMQTTTALDEDRKATQLAYYQVRNPDAMRVHTSMKREIACVGGNRSSKTDTMLAELAIQATGHIPVSLMGVYPREKIRAPIRARIVCNSLTDTLEPVIKPKLRWDHWNGVGDPAAGRGHWGWIPRSCLVGGSWEKAYSERYRTLHVSVDSYWRGPDGQINSVSGLSSIQMMCLDLEAQVLRADGTWKALGDIMSGEEVATGSGPFRVLGTHRFDSAPAWRITTRDGRAFYATKHHRHFLADGECVTTSELLLGDRLKLWPVAPQCTDAAAEEWRLGWTAIMIGDGCLRQKQAAFSAISGSRVLRDLPPLPPGCRLVTMGDGVTHKVALVGRRRDNPLVMSLKEDGLWGRFSHEKFVPPWVFRQPLDQVRRFLEHLWATDGTGWLRTNGAYDTTSRQLAFDVRHLLWRCGFRASINGPYRPNQNQRIRGQREHYRVRTQWAPLGDSVKVRSIERAEDRPVACLTTEGSFVANGILTGNSYDQTLSAFAGSSLHWVGHDELPPSDIYRENRLRTLDVRGQIVTAFTPPDEAGPAQTDASWFFDEVYEPGLPGPNQHPEIDTVTLFTERNTILKPEDVRAIAERLTDAQRQVRLFGKFIHLSGVVYPLFERTYAQWCYRCQKRVLAMGGVCQTCQGDDVGQFGHVIEPFPIPAGWPVVMVIDPHPRKADAIGWFAVAPSDDCFLMGELEVSGTAKDVARAVRDFEDAHRLRPVKRLMDPNIATETNDRMQRGWTIRQEYDKEGLRCDLANDEINAGISQVNEFLRPDPRTRRPRLVVFNTCPKMIYGMTHWTWDEWTRGHDREPKEKTRDRHKDFPDLMRYFVLDRPSYGGYTRGLVFRHRRRGG